MDKLDKKFYRIREVAEIIGLPASTLRFWEKEFTLIHPRRTDHNARLYTPADIEVLRMIRYLVKEKGLKLDAAEEEIRNNRSGVSKRYEAVERLRSIRARLLDLQKAMSARGATIRQAMRARKAAEEKAAEEKAAATPAAEEKVAPVKAATTTDYVPQPAAVEKPQPTPKPEAPAADSHPRSKNSRKKGGNPDAGNMPTLF